MSLIRSFLVGLGRELARVAAPRALDYGCGAGELVELANEAGIDCVGVDVFYEGGSYRDAAEKRGALGRTVFEIEGERIPMADASFDIVFANQVFEHIDDFTMPLAEIARVLKPGGVFLNAFPTREVWREGHCGIPFLHRFPKHSRFPRHLYALALRTAGLGYNTRGKTRADWVADFLRWLDDWTFYKEARDVEQAFARHFDIADRDADYFRARLAASRLGPLLGPASALRAATPFAAFLARRLATRVFVLQKRETGEALSRRIP